MIEAWLGTRGSELDLSNGSFSELPSWLNQLSSSRGDITPDLAQQLTREFGRSSVFGEVGSRHALLLDMSDALERVISRAIEFHDPSEYINLDQLATSDRESATQLSDSLDEFFALAGAAVDSDIPWTARQLQILADAEGQMSYPHLGTLVRLSRTLTTACRSIERQVSKRIYTRLVATKVVSLQINLLTRIPDFINNLPRLEQLFLDANRLLLEPEDLALLPPSLKVLDIGTSDLRRLSTIAGPQLRSIEHLAISGSQCSPTLTILLPKLRTLMASDVKGLAEINVDAPDLNEVDLSSTYLINYDGILGRTPRLKIARLSRSALTTLPSFISAELAAVDASENDLTELSTDSFERAFESLDVVDLRANAISALPDDIDRFTRLTSLDLSDNVLTSLPASLSRMSALREIHLSGNPLPDTVLKAARGSADDLLEFIRALGVNPAISSQAKALVIGEGAVGKTSLIGAICKRDFIENRPTTHGIELSPVSLEGGVGESLLDDRLVFWDFGGQEVYRVTHPFFFSKDAIYLVTWRPREGMEQAGLEFWLEAIRHRVGVQNCSVLLVSTHAEEGRTSRIDEEAIENEYYPAIKGFFSVDSETGIGVDAIRSRCHQLLQELPHYGGPIPTAWVELRRALPAVADGFLLLGQYESIAADHGLNPAAARSCARLLNTLGDLLYFDESDGLAPAIVTDPEILTRAVSYLMEDVDIQAHGGLVELRRVREIWERQMPEVKANPDVVGVLINLIRRFDVGLEVRAGPGVDALLLPDMVPFARPLDLPWEPRDAPRVSENELRLDIHCSTTPTGLLPWMTVRNFQLVRNWMWRNGAYFERPEHGAAALLEWSSERRVLSLTVRGTYPLDTFQGLKRDVETLMATRWPYLPLSYLIPCPHRFEERCDGAFELDYVERKLKGRDRSGECRACLREVDLGRLLTGIGPAHDRLAVIEGRLDEVRTGNEDLRRVAGEMTLSLRHLREDLVRGLDDTPLVFTIAPSGWRGGSRISPRRLWSQPFSVQLWCEHWDGPHPCGDEYEIRVERDWFARCYPYLKHVSGILRLSSIVRSAGDMLVDDARLDGAKDALDFIDACRDLGLTSGAIGLSDSDASDGSGMTSGPMGIEARFIRSLILDLEPAPRTFRGLQPLVMPGRAVTWLCPEHFVSARERPILDAVPALSNADA